MVFLWLLRLLKRKTHALHLSAAEGFPKAARLTADGLPEAKSCREKAWHINRSACAYICVYLYAFSVACVYCFPCAHMPRMNIRIRIWNHANLEPFRQLAANMVEMSIRRLTWSCFGSWPQTRPNISLRKQIWSHFGSWPQTCRN